MHGLSNNELPWAWSLVAGSARRIDAIGAPRWLRVDDGNVWLTATQGDLGEHPDVWLSGGESVRLPAASQWVIEGRGPARYTLMQEAGEEPSRRFWLWLKPMVSSRRVCAY